MSECFFLLAPFFVLPWLEVMFVFVQVKLKVPTLIVLHFLTCSQSWILSIYDDLGVAFVVSMASVELDVHSDLQV